MIDPATLPAFSDMASRIRLHAMQAPDRPALIEGARRLDYAALDRQMDRIAAALQRDGVAPGEAVGICAASSIEYACVFLGALRAGVAVAPLAPGATPASLHRMLADADAKLLFTARDVDVGNGGEGGPPRIALDGSAAGRAFDDWQLRVRRLVDVSKVDTSTELFGVKVPAPILVAPTGGKNLVLPNAEAIVARMDADDECPAHRLARQVMLVHRGAITAGPRPGGGARFRLTF